MGRFEFDIITSSKKKIKKKSTNIVNDAFNAALLCMIDNYLFVQMRRMISNKKYF